MRPHERHRHEAERRLRAEVVTVSTSKYEKKTRGEHYTDETGDTAVAIAAEAGHNITRRSLVSDEKTMIRREVRRFLAGDDDMLLLAGGTGLSPRDVTVETVKPFLEKELEGFGELVRRLSYDEVGSASALTRATAGVAKGKLIVCMPGSPGAVKTAMRAFVGEFPHMVYIARG